MVFYLPPTCNSEFENAVRIGERVGCGIRAEVGRVIEIDSAEDLEELPQQLGAE